MSRPLSFRGKMLLGSYRWIKHVVIVIKNNNILFIAAMLTIFGLTLRFWNNQQTFYAQAYEADTIALRNSNVPFFENQEIFKISDTESSDLMAVLGANSELQEKQAAQSQFAQKIYEIVGDAPISEMVPYISQRDEKVAAFLVGIAKKESSFGFASPLKDGKTCYNYWGYKGSGGRGTGMGYACFASPEEAIKVVGDRIEVLVNKDRNTPARMVDTWKCGKSCAGDPGAPGWIATVALYFNKLVG
ncbi:MAG: hypothetical protein ACD_9C00246G0009 [uncultured bacterium]|nr:MAG: hypothetical protein ACD_9C00246G0009 [uncultured bacterium]